MIDTGFLLISASEVKVACAANTTSKARIVVQLQIIHVGKSGLGFNDILVIARFAQA